MCLRADVFRLVLFGINGDSDFSFSSETLQDSHRNCGKMRAAFSLSKKANADAGRLSRMALMLLVRVPKWNNLFG